MRSRQYGRSVPGAVFTAHQPYAVTTVAWTNAPCAKPIRPRTGFALAENGLEFQMQSTSQLPTAGRL
jgi:hypothetical protein